jgi:phosphatidylserine/phosphatidylglycerophosphate/cardiolipin synthase-like enzyme
VVDGEQAFISSANFTEAAHERNIEVGVLLRSSPSAKRLIAFFEHLIGSGHLVLIVPQQ